MLQGSVRKRDFLVPIILISFFCYLVFAGDFDMLMFLLNTAIFLVLYYAVLAYCGPDGARLIYIAYGFGGVFGGRDIFGVLSMSIFYLLSLGEIYFDRRELCKAAREAYNADLPRGSTEAALTRSLHNFSSPDSTA